MDKNISRSKSRHVMVQNVFIILFLLCTLSCTWLFKFAPGSKLYEPPPGKLRELFKTHRKNLLPNEIKENIDSMKGTNIHLLGIIDTFWVTGNEDSSELFIKAEHKYWDYILDFSIQRETMFVSPKGEGSFIYHKIIRNKSLDTINLDMSKMAEKNNIGMFYGTISGIKDSSVIIEGNGFGYIHRQFYSTNIWEYEPLKDNSGNLITGENGLIQMGEVKVLKIPEAGINDPEDKKFE